MLCRCARLCGYSIITMRQQLQSGRFYGRTRRKHCFGDLRLADVEYRSHSRLPIHSHEHPYFCLIRRGTYLEKYSRRTRVCRPLMLVFHPAGERHHESIGDESVLSFNVELGPKWLDRLREFGGMLDQPVEFQGCKIVRLCIRLFHEFASMDLDSELSINSTTSEILADYVRTRPVAPNVKPDWLIRASEYLDASMDVSPSLERVANRVGIHPVHLATVFRRFNGCSVGEYVRRRRVRYARQLLAYRELQLAEIAQRAGFADQSHFTRIYKRLTGRTPLQDRTFLAFKTPPNPTS